MSGTPRLRSAYTPTSDPTNLRPRIIQDGLRRSFGSPDTQAFANSQRPSQPVKQPIGQGSTPAVDTPLIPLDVIDAPSQRAYVAGLYLVLLVWKLSNYGQISDELDSTWFFLKWNVIDMLFLFGLPALHVPWLELSFFSTLTIYLVHFVANAFLMFRIPIPIIAWAGSLLKVVYDRELSISDHRVDPTNILRNSSLIMGKQIIQFLPEGSAILNLQRESFCLGPQMGSVDLPIQINQTTPALIELLRYDLDTFEPETIIINPKQVRQLKRLADKLDPNLDNSSPRVLRYTVRKTGLYQLQRVIDESKLEVRKRNYDTLVASCPEALLHTARVNKCKGELSDIVLNVTGIPPFKVTYSKRINREQSTSSVQTVQPSGLDSRLSVAEASGTLVDPQSINLEWAKPLTITVPINESLTVDGLWSYAVEQVEDGSGNVIRYPSESDGEDASLASVWKQRVTVHNRPRVFFDGCSDVRTLLVPREFWEKMPLVMQPSGPLVSDDWPLHLTYIFAPETSDEIDAAIETKTLVLESMVRLPALRKAGKYSLDSIRSQFCAGDISEPSSCIVAHPERPDVTLTKEDMSDSCAGNTVGLRINFDFVGTPPFILTYRVLHQGSPEMKTAEFNGLRGQLEFRPTLAGSYEYQFLSIQDEFYTSISLEHKSLLLKQDIKPPASAKFMTKAKVVEACLDQAVVVDVKLFGAAPWKLEYELVQGGKRKKCRSSPSHQSILLPRPPSQAEVNNR